jgi:hypothetical protein
MTCLPLMALPFLIPGEDRRPKLSFGLLVDGKLKHVVEIVEAYGDFLANSSLLRQLLYSVHPC